MTAPPMTAPPMTSDAARARAAASPDAWLYRVAQRVLAPGAQRRLGDEVARVLGDWRPGAAALDVGCADDSLLCGVGVEAIGLDRMHGRLRHYAGTGRGVALQADARSLPIRDGALELVFSCGLLHHLSDADASCALAEMRRVLATGGRVLLIDAVLPRRAWRRPLAALIRAADRGRFMRTESALRALLYAAIPAPGWSAHRLTYTATGLEGLVCWTESGAACR